MVLIFLVLGGLTAHLIVQFSEAHESEYRLRPTILSFYSRLIDDISPDDPMAMIQKIKTWTGDFPMTLLLLNEKGEVLYPAGEDLPLPWAELEKPQKPHDEVALFPKRGQGPPEFEVVKLKHEPPLYVGLKFNAPGNGPAFRGVQRGFPPPPPFYGRRLPPMFLLTYVTLLLSVFLGVGAALLLILRSVRGKALLADQVISELQKGNLKARFPIGKRDEFGEAMSRFNKMADEIENLVERLRTSEHSRMALLQELAHDLRTPVASLRHLVETVYEDDHKMKVENRKELLSLSLKEIDYFQRLVEDLLVLAQVSEPRYRPEQNRVDVKELIEEESDRLQSQLQSLGKSIKIECIFPDEDVEVIGDAHLLRRMVRNVFENAFSFAKGVVKVELKIEATQGEIQMLVSDDGPGLSPEALLAYGERRVTRVLGSSRDPLGQRVSVGLGSVIVKAVAEVHRGHVAIANRTDDGQTLGAEVTLRLPWAPIPSNA